MFKIRFKKNIEAKADEETRGTELREKLRKVVEEFRPMLSYSRAVREASYHSLN